MQLKGRQTQFYIDLIYGIGFAAGFGYLLFVGMDARVAAFQGGLVFGYFLRVWENMSVYERILHEEVAAEAEDAVADELEQTMPGEVEEAVADEIEETMPDEVEEAVAEEAEEAVPEEVTAEVEKQVADEITEEIIERVEKEIEEHVGRRVPEKVKEVADQSHALSGEEKETSKASPAGDEGAQAQ